MQGPDLNQRPSGYEPDELPDCSTLRYILNYRHFFLQIYHILKILLKTIFFAELTDKFQCSKHCLRYQPQAQQWCRRPESNRYGKLIPQDFKSWASASSATPAKFIVLNYNTTKQYMLSSKFCVFFKFFYFYSNSRLETSLTALSISFISAVSHGVFAYLTGIDTAPDFTPFFDR